MINLFRLAWVTAASLAFLTSPAESKTVQFAGYSWEVRSGHGGPGPNTWSSNNVWVDAQGRLHLKFIKRGDRWTAAEVYTTKRFGFGTFTFKVKGRLDSLDRNVVLGLFTYPTEDVGPDTTHEIDIEIARWGIRDADPLNFTVWPVKDSLPQTGRTFPITWKGDSTLHRFTWGSKSIAFQSFKGSEAVNANRLGQWTYRPGDSARRIAQKAQPLHINLWGFQGKAPANGNSVEFVIEDFTYRKN